MLFCLKFSWNQTGGRLKQDCCRIKRKYPSLEMWDLKFEFQTPNKKSNPRKNLKKKNCEVSGKFQIPPLRRKKFVIYTTTVLLQSPTSFGSAECSKKNTHPLILWEDGVLCPSEKWKCYDKLLYAHLPWIGAHCESEHSLEYHTIKHSIWMKSKSFHFAGLMITGGSVDEDAEVFPANANCKIPPFPSPGKLSSCFSFQQYLSSKGDGSTPSLWSTTPLWRAVGMKVAPVPRAYRGRNVSTAGRTSTP